MQSPVKTNAPYIIHHVYQLGEDCMFDLKNTQINYREMVKYDFLFLFKFYWKIFSLIF